MNAGRSQEDFVRLYASAQPALQHYVAAHLPDLHEVDDVMQEVAVCLWKNFGKYTPGTSFPKWAFRVAHFEVLHARRAHARSRLVLAPNAAERAAERFEALDVRTVEARRRALEHCLKGLPSPQRDLILARYRAGMSPSRIAEEWGRTDNLVWVQLFRIRAALRRCVQGVLGKAEGVSV